MSSVNKVMILGRLGQDPELKTLPTGQNVCNFSVATSESWTDKASGKKQEKTEWHRVVVWGKLAELCGKYLVKGKQAFVEGKIETRSWDDKDGNKRYSTEVKANNVTFLNGNADTNEALKTADDAKANPEYKVATNVEFASDDLPF